MEYELDEPNEIEHWQCPCSECNPHPWWYRSELLDEDAMMEPEFEGNREPRPISYWYYALERHSE